MKIKYELAKSNIPKLEAVLLWIKIVEGKILIS